MTQYPGPQYPTQFPGYQSPQTPTAPLRPTSVTVLAILGIIFGGMGVLCKPLSLAAIFIPQPAPNPAVEMQKDMMAFNLANAAVGTAVSVLLLAASIGCLSLKPWARKGMLTYAGLALALTVVGAIITFVWMMPKIQEMQRQMMAQQSAGGTPPPPQMMSIVQSAGTIGAVLGTVGALIYPTCLLYFFTRPNVKSAFGDPSFAGAGHGAPPYGAPQPGGYYANQPPQPPPGQYPPQG